MSIEETKTLTSCQVLAKAEIETWLVDPDRPEFILSGSAGVGKSTLLELILGDISQVNDMRELLAVDQRLHEVLFAATTNKAASVINGETIFSLLGISIYNDFKTGEVKYNLKNMKEQFNCLIVVDESSMIDEKVLELIRQCCKNCKVLYVGDKNQLHPVGLDFSPVFDSEIEQVHMTTPCRQGAQTHLYSVISDVRKWVEQGGPVPVLREGPGVTHIQDAGLVDFVTNSGFSDKIITFTNNGCIQLNEFVRYKRGLDMDFFTENECVMSNTTTVSKDAGSRILTDAQYTIRKIGPEQSHFNMFNYRHCYLDGKPADVVCDSVQYSNILKGLKQKKDWRTYFTLKERFVDLRDAYAVTAHKSQGSTYDRVLINLTNFKRCSDMTMLARLLYVSISRARSEVFLYGSLT